MIEQLDTQIELAADVPGGVVNATHRGWGHTHQPWNDPPLVSYCVLGWRDTEGRFRPLANGDETILVRDTADHADYSACLDADGYLHGALVIAQHKVVRQRSAELSASADDAPATNAVDSPIAGQSAP